MKKIIIMTSLLLLTIQIQAFDLAVYGLKPSSDNGVYRCLIFNDAAGFPGTASNALQSVNGQIINNQGVCLFKNLTEGTYAVSTFHDANSNSKLDTNFLGIPKEKYGFSNNASRPFGPPTFAEAGFILKADSKLNINLK